MNELILENMPLVLSIVKGFNPRNYTEQEDLIDAGRIGLWKALVKYNTNSNGKISTYAWKSIRWFVIKEINRFKKYGYKEIKDEHYYINEYAVWELIPETLTCLEKQIIYLKIEGNSLKDISDILEISQNTAKYFLSKALKKIKKGINER